MVRLKEADHFVKCRAVRQGSTGRERKKQFVGQKEIDNYMSKLKADVKLICKLLLGRLRFKFWPGSQHL